MLYEEVEKREELHQGGIITGTGTCRFCQQVATHKVLEEWPQEKIDELVSETCECIEARIYAAKKGQKERAHERINVLFGPDNGAVHVPEAVTDLLHESVYPICERYVQNITVDMGNGIKAKISMTNGGIIKVVRAKTDTSTYEA